MLKPTGKSSKKKTGSDLVKWLKIDQNLLKSNLYFNII